MNILFLVHRVPHPPDKGDRIRSYRLLRLLSECGDVHLACLADEPVSSETREELSRLCRRVCVIPLDRLQRRLNAIASMALGRTATEGLFRSTVLRRLLSLWAQDTTFDVVVAYCSSMVPYLRLPALEQIPAVVDLVDVDSQKWFDYAEVTAWPLRSIFRTEGRRLRQLEIASADRAGVVTLVSEAEAKLFRQFTGRQNVRAIANGVDVDHFRPQEPTADQLPKRCTFVGALDYRANVDGLKWFCANVWPDVHRTVPHSIFSIVGRRPVEHVRRLGRLPGVEVVGAVEDVRPHYQHASLTVVPLRVARGIQNKVLEALAMGKAVVSSPAAIEGLDVTPDVHFLQACEPEEWVQQICHLLDRPSAACRLGAAGRDFVEKHHQWDILFQEFQHLLPLDSSSSPICAACGPHG